MPARSFRWLITVFLVLWPFQVYGACSPSSFVVSPSQITFDAAGGTGNVNLVVYASGAGCTWSLTTDVPWITLTITSGRNGQTVPFTVAQNGGGLRTGTLSVLGDDGVTRTLTVTQNPAGCSYAIASSSAEVAFDGGTVSIQVTSPAGCPWTVDTPPDAFFTANPAKGSGSGSVSINVAPNPTTTYRNSFLAIAGKSFQLIQAPTPCIISAEPTLILPSDTLTGTMGVMMRQSTGSTQCRWSASLDAEWLRLAKTTGLSGETISFNMDPNLSTRKRSAHMVFTNNQTTRQMVVTVHQLGSSCTFIIRPSALRFPGTGGTQNVSIETQSQCEWAAAVVGMVFGGSLTGYAETTLSTTEGVGTSSLAVTVAPNSKPLRLTNHVNVAGFTILIDQALLGQTLAPLSIELTSPAPYSTVWGVVDLVADVGNSGNISMVVFRRNGATIGKLTSPPFRYSWDTVGLSGARILSAQVFTTTSESVESLPVKVYVAGRGDVPNAPQNLRFGE